MCLGAVGSGTPAMHCLTAWGSGQWIFCNAVPHRLETVASGTRAMRRPTSWGDRESCPGGGHCRCVVLYCAVLCCALL